MLSDDERRVLMGWSRCWKTEQALAWRSRIVLGCANSGAIDEAATQLGVSDDHVEWRSRFLAARLEGLSDEPRPRRPRTITDVQVDAVINKTFGGRAGAGYALVDAVDGCRDGLSQSAVSRFGGRLGYKPHAVQTGKLSTHDTGRRSSQNGVVARTRHYRPPVIHLLRPCRGAIYRVPA